MTEVLHPETRLYVPEALAAGGEIALTPAQAHRLRNVRRLEDGAAVALFNGRDGEWLASLRFGRRDAVALPLRRRRPQAEAADLWLAFAPVKHARLEFLVEKATELGVGALYPVITRHTQVARVNAERLAETAREAAEQCERLTLPTVHEPQPLAALLAGWDATRVLFACAEAGAAAPIAAACAGQAGKPAAILTGPEGGFAPEELAALADCAFAVPVGLGPRLLRAETAAVAALACWQAVAGEWRGAAARPRADLLAAGS